MAYTDKRRVAWRRLIKHFDTTLAWDTLRPHLPLRLAVPNWLPRLYVNLKTSELAQLSAWLVLALGLRSLTCDLLHNPSSSMTVR